MSTRSHATVYDRQNCLVETNLPMPVVHWQSELNTISFAGHFIR